MEDGVHLLGDGHFDTPSLRQSHRRRRSENSFCNHAVHPCEDFLQPSSAAKFHAYAAIARESASAG